MTEMLMWLFLKRWKPVAAPAPAGSPLDQAIAILVVARHKVWNESEASPEWVFLVHAEAHLEKQREEYFRWRIGATIR